METYNAGDAQNAFGVNIFDDSRRRLVEYNLKEKRKSVMLALQPAYRYHICSNVV